MYKVASFSVPFEKPAGFPGTMYPMRNLNLSIEEPKCNMESIVKKQGEVISRIEKFIEKSQSIAKKCGLPDEILTVIMPSPDVETKQPWLRKSPYIGNYEIVCCASGMIPFSLIALPDWIPGGVSANVETVLYAHSSLLLSNSTTSRRFEHALKILKQKVPLFYHSDQSQLSLIARIIVQGESEKNDLLSFYVRVADTEKVGQTTSKCLTGELVLLRCVMRLLGLALNDEVIDDILAFSKAANNCLTSNNMQISKQSTSPTALALQSLSV